MSSSGQDYGLGYVYRPASVWSYPLGFPTVIRVEDDAARTEFRAALGRTLAMVRKRLTPYRSQQAMADALGVDRETYGRWERGVKEPRVYDLARIWSAFDVPADWLLDPTDSLKELDRRIAMLRHERMLRAALEAAHDEGEGTGLADA
jgi:transcriptional regulator with XRE-family HTH domain